MSPFSKNQVLIKETTNIFEEDINVISPIQTEYGMSKYS